MVKIFKIIILVLGLGISCGNAFAQKQSSNMAGKVISYSKNNQKQDKLTMPMLKSASRIIYGFSNGAVHPDYQYAGYIIVTPNEASLKIYHQSKVSYYGTQKLTAKQYSAFLNNLFSLGIKPNLEDPMMLCGGGVEDLTIEKNGKVIFKGEENETIVTTKGHLRDAFEPLLNKEMKAVYKDPTSTFDQPTDDFLDEIHIN